MSIQTINYFALGALDQYQAPGSPAFAFPESYDGKRSGGRLLRHFARRFAKPGPRMRVVVEDCITKPLLEEHMPSSQGLKEVYIDEMRDLWSANEQMQQFMKSLRDRASDKALQELLDKSVAGIGKHTETLRSVLENTGGNAGTEHCRAMEGLVAEARKHALDEELDPELRDLVIIAQYQRMSHYGLAGFGTAAAYAAALGDNDGATKLKTIVKDIYRADEFTSQLAERAERAAASHA